MLFFFSREFSTSPKATRRPVGKRRTRKTVESGGASGLSGTDYSPKCVKVVSGALLRLILAMPPAHASSLASPEGSPRQRVPTELQAAPGGQSWEIIGGASAAPVAPGGRGAPPGGARRPTGASGARARRFVLPLRFQLQVKARMRHAILVYPFSAQPVLVTS